MKLVPTAALTDLPPPPAGKIGWPWTDSGQDDGAPVLANWPRISIVTPSYNQGRFLEQAIRSVLLQNYPNLEYIVIDGRSTDDASSILQKYADFLSYSRSVPDDGQADALSQGFQMASGEILAWINADDYYEPHAFKRIARFFNEHPGTVFVNGDVNLVNEDGAFIRKIYAMRPNHFFAANLGQHGWPQQGCFWRRTAYDAVGGVNAGYQFCIDLDLFTRLVEFGNGRRFSGSAIANFRVHPASKTATMPTTLHQEKSRVINTYGHPIWSARPGAMGALWWVYRKQAAVRRRWDHLKR